jgi:peptidoglycan/LPS O-acetylase OafA/YrhL
MKNRLAVVDGFRAIAILGVLWAHIWMFFNNPKLNVFGVDLSPIFTFWGNGVDLFFVISGFCMYLMFINKYQAFNFGVVKDFVIKRFLRIAPAFYMAILGYYLWDLLFETGNNNWPFAITNVFFINTILGISGPAPHFWSLNTEWQFYLLLPLLMFVFKKNYTRNIFLLLAITICIRLAFAIYNHDPYNIINYSIVNRFFEFGIGMVLCKHYLENKIPKFMQSIWFFIIAFAIAFVGRVLLTAAFQNRTDLIGVFSRTINIPLLSLGFALMIGACLGKENLISKFISNKFFLYIGKYSYSMYLWHWMIAAIVSNFAKKYINVSDFNNVNIAFILSVILLIPISIASYKWFEAFYFKFYSSKK